MSDYLYTTKRVRIKRGVVMHVKRHLKYSKCDMHVSAGQEVTPMDKLAECKVPPGFQAIPLAKMLGVHPKEGKNYLKREAGKNIYKGELLASKLSLITISEPPRP